MTHGINSMGLAKTRWEWSSKNEACKGLQQLLCVYVMVIRLLFCGTPCSGNVFVSNSFDCSWDSFSPIVLLCPASIWGLLPHLSITRFLFLILFYLLETYSVMKVDGIWKFSGSEAEGELEEVEGAGMY